MSTEQMQEAVSAFDKLEILGLLSPDADFASFWSGWKASRAALVVELPLPPKAQRSDEEATFSAGGCDMLRKCQKAIESAGISIKQPGKEAE